MIEKQNHYASNKIEPVIFIGMNDLCFFVGNIIKYTVRYKMKNGVEDLKKARHYLDMLIYKEQTGVVDPYLGRREDERKQNR